jgi:hypothetical protein
MGSLRARLDRLEHAVTDSIIQREVARLAAESHLSPNEVLAHAMRLAARWGRHPLPRRADGQIDYRRWCREEARAKATVSGTDLADALRHADELAAEAEANERQRRAARQALRR